VATKAKRPVRTIARPKRRAGRGQPHRPRTLDSTGRKYAALFETSPAGLLVTHIRERRIVEINDAALGLLGLKREQAIGALAADLGRALDPQALGTHFSFVRRDGRQVDTVLSGARVEFDGEPHLVVSVLDVTEQRRLERERLAAEQKFAVLFENSPEPISLLRVSDQVRLAANSAWERATGYSRDRASAQPAQAASLFPDPAQRDALIGRIVAQGRVSNHQQRLRRADGTEFDALVSGVRIEVEGERCILWNWRDMTEQRRVKRAQREADARYSTLFHAALEGMIIASPQNIVLDANPAACEITGFTRSQLVGEHASRLYSAEELTARPIRSDLTDRWSVVERTLKRKDGRTVSVEVFAGPMPDGNVLAILRDITERKRNETLLMNLARGVGAQFGDAFFRSLVEHLSRELGADLAFVGELVAPANEQVRTLAFLVDGALEPRAEYPVAGSMSEKVLAGRGAVVYPHSLSQLFPKNAELRKHRVEAYVGTPLYATDGNPLGVLAVGHRGELERPQFWASMIEIFGARAAAEIERARAEALVRRANESLEQTVRERTAELEEANRELDSYNYSISHDLRQPLSAITGFAELMRDPSAPPLGAAALECLVEIENNALRMEQMIDSLMRLARAGRGAIRKTELDMKNLVEDVLHELESAGPLGAAISIGALPAAQGDAVLLRQVWKNLIGNALKYSRDRDPGRVEIDGVRRDGMVEYSVRDNGIGFDMQHVGRLFGTFQRLPTAAAYEGTGVGLTIVERIVRRHGGKVEAESTPGAGATFRFTLPD
jgi:PAS domain S-box-containing protein